MALLLTALLFPLGAHGFFGPSRVWSSGPRRSATCRSMSVGWGETEAYRWQEQVDEVEVMIRVPASVRADSVEFRVTSQTIFLATTRDSAPLLEVWWEYGGCVARAFALTIARAQGELVGTVVVDGCFWTFGKRAQARAILKSARALTPARSRAQLMMKATTNGQSRFASKRVITNTPQQNHGAAS